MDRHGTKRALYKFTSLIMLRHAKAIVFTLTFLTMLSSNAEMHNDANSSLSYPGVDAITKSLRTASVTKPSKGHDKDMPGIVLAIYLATT